MNPLPVPIPFWSIIVKILLFLSVLALAYLLFLEKTKKSKCPSDSTEASKFDSTVPNQMTEGGIVERVFGKLFRVRNDADYSFVKLTSNPYTDNLELMFFKRFDDERKPDGTGCIYYKTKHDGYGHRVCNEHISASLRDFVDALNQKEAILEAKQSNKNSGVKFPKLNILSHKSSESNKSH